MDADFNDSGVYCFLPFDKLDKYKKGVFKIGNTGVGFQRRLSQYHTYYPNGVYVIAFIKISNKKNHLIPENIKHILNLVESYVLKLIQEKNGVVIVNKKRKYKNGETEWIYSSLHIIDKCFHETALYFKTQYKNLHFIVDSSDVDKTIKQIEKDFKNTIKMKNKFIATYTFNTNPKIKD